MANDAPKKANLQEIEWDSIEGTNSDFETVYPRLQWVHGDPRAGQGIMKSGGFFISGEQFPMFQGEGFTKQTLITQDGKEIEGFGAKEVKLAVVRIKTQWTQNESQKNVPLLQALVFVKGCEDVLCLSLKGASKALVFNKEFQKHIAQNIATANKTRPANAPTLEPFALWFPVKAGDLSTISAKDGNSSSKVTYPEILQPKEINREYVTGLWVGGNNYKTFCQLWKDTKLWQNERIFKQVAQETGEIHESLDGVINEAQIKQLSDLAIVKDVLEKEFVLTLTNGETDRFEALRKSEFKEALDRLKVM